MFTTKANLSILLTIILVSSSILAYYRLHNQSKTQNHPTIAQQVQDAKKGYQEAKKASSKAVEQVKKLKPLDQVVQVGSVLTSEELSELQTRDTTELQAIQALQVSLASADQVISLQDTYIIQLKRDIWIFKIVAGLVILITIIVIL